MKSVIVSLIMLSVTSAAMAFDPGDGNKNSELKKYMKSIYSSISVILPMHLSQKGFYEPAQHKLILGHLENISSRAKEVSQVLRQNDEEHRVLSRSLATYANSAYKSFKVGATDQAYYFTEEMVETCLSCHTSRKSPGDSAFASLAGRLDFQELGPFARAKFLAISRQFDKALQEYEQVFEKNPPTLAEILHFDPFLQYMTVGIRVTGDSNRVRKLLEKLLKKDQYAASVKSDIKIWIKSLDAINNPRFAQGSILQQAKALLKEGRSLMEYPRDQAGVVYFLEASRRLKDFIQKTAIKPADRAAAYLLTGKTEMVLGRPYLGPEAKHYFEIAILSAPGSKIAREAFDMYQENLIFGYTGSSGIHLPEDEKEKLEFLRKKSEKE